MCPILCLALALATAPAWGVTIYRFGGQDLPPPDGAGEPGVVFRQLSWDSLGTAGSATRLRLADDITPKVYNDLSILPLVDRNSSSLRPLFDQFALTCGLCAFLNAAPYRCQGSGGCSGRYGNQGTYNIELGDRLFVRKVRIRSGTQGNGVLADFGLYLSPEPLRGESSPQLPFTLEVTDNDDGDLQLTGFAGQVRTAEIQLALAEHEYPVVLKEIEVVADGASSHAVYVSDVIDFGRPAVWGGLRWAYRESIGSTAHLATRGGSGGDLLKFWKYTGIADQRVEVTRAEYEALRSTLRAGTTYNYDNWTVWSPQASLADTLSTPPMPIAPERLFQAQVEFRTTGFDAGALDYLEFRASVPAVSRVVGELAPIEVEPGALTEFSYTLKPRVGPTDTGFDRIRIAAVAAQIDSVLGVVVDEVEVPYEVESLQADALRVRFPRVGLEHADAAVQVRFRARALRYGAAFAAFLLDSERPYDVPQAIPPGDAKDEVLSDRVWIETKVAVHAVLAVVAQPATITPNGDGVNDATSIGYDLFETTGAVPVRVVITDLSGRAVRDLHSARQEIGHYEVGWDGRDDGGRLVPPGIYLFRAEATLNGRDFARVGIIHVAY